MAGSLNHLVTEDGAFTFDLIDNLGDAHEACEECFDIIAHLVNGDVGRLRAACEAVRAPVPEAVPVQGKRVDDFDDGYGDNESEE